MKAIFSALLLAAAVALAACQPEDEFFTWATVVGVQEVEQGKEPEELTLHDEDLRIPEVGWKIDLRLDDGSPVSVTRNGRRRYEPGERVRLLKADDGELLL